MKKADRDETKQRKLGSLASGYGLSVERLLERYTCDSVVPGICMNDECDNTCEYEPDQRSGWCDVCETNSVTSLLVLAGCI